MISCPNCGNLNPPTAAACFRCNASLVVVAASAGAVGLGQVIDGRYRVESALGAGAMGNVFAASDLRLNRRVALKVLNEELNQHPTARVRMEREAKALATINHPNVVKINNVFAVDRSLVLDLELVTGGTLAERSGRGAMTPQASLGTMGAILAGLHAIHCAGLVHRDMKPANVLMTKQGVPKIADLGIAHQLDGVRITRMGAALGTPQYMSPEQIRGQSVTHATDIYACGVMLYEMLTGVPLFQGDSAHDVEAAHVSAAPDLRRLGGLPQHVVNAVARALEKRPEMRWTSAVEFAAALCGTESQGLQGGRTVFEPTPPLPLPPEAVRIGHVQPRGTSGATKWLAGGAVLVAVAGAGLLGLVLLVVVVSSNRGTRAEAAPVELPVAKPEPRRPVAPPVTTPDDPPVYRAPPPSPPAAVTAETPSGRFASVVVPAGFNNGKVHAAPDMRSGVIVEIPAGTRLSIVSGPKYTYWYEVAYSYPSSGQGWMHKDLLSFE